MLAVNVLKTRSTHLPDEATETLDEPKRLPSRLRHEAEFPLIGEDGKILPLIARLLGLGVVHLDVNYVPDKHLVVLGSHRSSEA